ncbi:MAG: glucoamylase family protein [Pyrinomonadaceae bacterium]
MAGDSSPLRHREHGGGTEKFNPLCKLRALCVSVLKIKLRHAQLNRHLASFLLVLFTLNASLALPAQQPKTFPFVPTLSSSRSLQDEAFLEDLERRSFQYFWEQSDPRTGLTLDRTRTDGSEVDENHRNVASIAATGFGLTALCIASNRHWVGAGEVRKRVLSSLRFFAEEAKHEHGWFYHWMDARTGERRWNSEVSSIDTALLLAGVLTARGYFRNDAEIVSLATRIYERVDFRWMLNGHPVLLSHGWKPESGFLKPRWDTFSEDTLLYMLAIASPTHSITPRSWYAFRRERMSYAGYNYITTIGVPLFMHQYAHAWIDYRNRRESRGTRTDYFANSIAATRAHRAFCISLSKEFSGYGPDIWGITASDSEKGYVAWSGPPRDPAIDGTLVPCAAGGSLMFTPDISLAALKNMRERFGERVYGKYGFVDAFNPTSGWTDTDVIGIDIGITLLSAENLRTGNVWQWFMRNREITRAMQLIGLREERQKVKVKRQKFG